MAQDDDDGPLLPRLFARRMEKWRHSAGRGSRGLIFGTVRAIVYFPFWMVRDWWDRLSGAPIGDRLRNFALGLPALLVGGFAAALWYT
ncbi:MAG TPA: hypothetical protein VNC50_01370, partial [Planctomycetia bacterium]|nr:hypothetical protein [Planctomycetia bacterium]